jgi:hypothetical protein
VVLIYLILEQAARLEIIRTRRAGRLWLTALFALGTTFWWLSMMGRVWFTSQIFTVFFTALAVLFALKRWSPWLAGTGLGLAMLARPNVFTLWPLLLGLAVYLDHRERQSLRWKYITGWSLQSVIPLAAAAGALLYYNYIRFGHIFDFGYISVNSAEYIMSAAQTYGIFHPHFLARNAHMMFLKMPTIQMRGSCLYFSPSREGISILAMTPAVLYLFRRVKLNLWTAGAWTSVLMTAGLLLLYHNTGSWQLGYRYLMDFIIPVLLLMALGIGKRPSWLFKALVIASVAGNLAGIIWWFNKWPC